MIDVGNDTISRNSLKGAKIHAVESKQFNLLQQ